MSGQHAITPGTFSMISVLFVDDNTDLFGQIRSFLEKGGDIRLDTARSIKQAIEKMKGRTYDVILSYEQIPEVNGIEFVSDMNGIEFLKYLKSSGNSTPVILLGRRGSQKIAVQEVTIGTEISIPKNGDIRPYLLEMVTLIKQTMLRRKAEREIKVQNDQLTAILSATPLGIFQVRNQVITWVNPQFAQMLGYEESYLVGKEIASFFTAPEDFERVSHELRITRSSHGFSVAECSLVKKDHTSLVCQLRVQTADPPIFPRSPISALPASTNCAGTSRSFPGMSYRSASPSWKLAAQPRSRIEAFSALSSRC